MTPTALRWHGGKAYLAQWIRSHFPDDGWNRYVEPFAGGLSVLLAGDGEGVAEFVNDLNGELINFWRVLASPSKFARMLRILEAIPLAETFWRESREAGPQDESSTIRAARFFVRIRQSRQGLGRDYVTPTSRTRRGMNEQVSAWLSAVDGLPEIHARLRRVEIIGPKPAVEVIRKLDSPKTLFYLDPPYLHSTRSTTGEYAHEMTEADHEELLNTLVGIKGRFILSGYQSSLYRDYAAVNDWHLYQKQIDNKASGSKTKEPRVECLWTNYYAKPEPLAEQHAHRLNEEERQR